MDIDIPLGTPVRLVFNEKFRILGSDRMFWDGVLKHIGEKTVTVSLYLGSLTIGRARLRAIIDLTPEEGDDM